ncbi:D-amino-acid oxidase [Mumia flava]|uniref:D-amino-acid oxidase n=1 Tax=Mumia flava TaxID=1348852 RepID=A0A0B2BL36_9ACTN|nr:FAD-dependent oxidoreductase [Mumia flava]PJJ56440.1 D-amino-acid oxidase [Mumia flava]
MRVLVVGAGVTGLTCAVVLAERGHTVDVVARDLPAETTSAVAAAWWYPYLVEPRHLVLGWAARTYEVLTGLAVGVDAVAVRRAHVLFRTAQPDPWWAEAVPELGREAGLPDGFADGWTFAAPVARMDAYLPYLASRLEAAGGTVTRMALSALPDGADAVVDASGLGARLLAGDDTVTPTRGQVLVLDGHAVDDAWLVDDAEGLMYVVPRGADVVVGGTSESGDWTLAPRPEQSEQILARARAIVGGLETAHVRQTKVGLRPSRPAVRLEVEQRADASPVVHCYGHGGAGVTLSWGCAEDVADLVDGLT